MNFRNVDQEKRKIRANVDLTPLIDVVFQLLIFFMLSSTFVVQTSIQIEMPRAEGAEKLEQKDLSITLTVDEGGPENGGAMFIDSDPIHTWEQLSDRLAAEVADRGEEEALLLIRADGRVPMARTVRVWGIATSVGIQRFGVAAQPLEEE